MNPDASRSSSWCGVAASPSYFFTRRHIEVCGIQSPSPARGAHAPFLPRTNLATPRNMELSRGLIIPMFPMPDCRGRGHPRMFLVSPTLSFADPDDRSFDCGSQVFGTGLCFVTVYLLLQRYGSCVTFGHAYAGRSSSAFWIMQLAVAGAAAIDDFCIRRVPVAKVVERSARWRRGGCLKLRARPCRYGNGILRDRRSPATKRMKFRTPNTF